MIKTFIISGIFLLFYNFSLISKNFTTGYFTPDTEYKKLFFQGIKSTLKSNFIHINSCKTDKDISLIITFNKKQLLNCLNISPKSKIFASFIEDTNYKSYKVIGAYYEKKIPYRKIILEIKNFFPSIKTIGIVLHNKIIIKDISNLVIYNPLVRIYEVDKTAEILYTFNEAIKQNDYILLIPDNFIINYITFQKIIKLLNENNKKYAAYSKEFLNLGANFIYEIDYYNDGKMIANFLNNYFTQKNFIFKKFYPENLKFYIK